MQTFCSGSPAVWVLMLDRTVSNLVPEAPDPGTSDVAEGMPANAETGRDVFDRLDAESTYFEQFMLQDVRSNRNAAAVFGGEALFEKLGDVMRKAELTASLVRFSIDEVAIPENSNNGEMESILRRCRVPLSAVADVDCRGIAAGRNSDHREEWHRSAILGQIWSGWRRTCRRQIDPRQRHNADPGLRIRKAAGTCIAVTKGSTVAGDISERPGLRCSCAVQIRAR